MNLAAITQFLSQKNVPSFRLKQIKEAFFKQFLSSFEEITNLPLDLRTELAQNFPWLSIKPLKSQGSLDGGVTKSLFGLSDGLKIESVLMVYRDWITACVSTMVGCPLNCSFCATGQIGFKRNLTTEEIIDQIVYWNQSLKPADKKVSRIVFMGMGEPFLNWENTWKAIEIINDKDALNIGQRHITISTAGIVPAIKNFADLDTQINLAISLHSPFQKEREKIMPVAKNNPLGELIKVAEYYVQKTKRKLFFEYALMAGFNDRLLDVVELKKIFTSPLFHLNLISLNPTDSKLVAASPEKLNDFTKLLDKYRLPYTLRRSIGTQIRAACGQLAGDEI